MSKTYKPYMNIPTGEFIKEELEVRHWGQEDLAKILGLSLKTVNQLIKSKQALTIDTARLLSKAFGQSPQYWLNLDSNYRLRLQEDSEKESTVSVRSMIFQYMPIRVMIKRGWLKNYENLDELVEQVKNFWGIDELDLTFLDESPLSCFRKSEAFTQYRPYAQTWLQMAKTCARKYTVKRFNKSRLKGLSNELISHTNSNRGIAEVLSKLNQVGIKFLVLRHLPKTYIDGAAFFDNGNPVIVYAQRYDRIDNFWFTLAHEIAHIIRDSKDEGMVFIDNLEELGSAQERQANAMAERFLGIHKIIKHFAGSRYIFEKKVLQYSEANNVNPGIVVGALQYHNKMSKKNLNKYKTKVSSYIPAEYYAENFV